MPGRQEQSHLDPWTTGGLEYEPQGLGWQGSSASTGSSAKTEQWPPQFFQNQHEDEDRLWRLGVDQN